MCVLVYMYVWVCTCVQYIDVYTYAPLLDTFECRRLFAQVK